jgi:uncharacterized membrane protein
MIYIVLFLSLLLRLISLNQSLWLDEATTALVSQMPVYDFFSKFMPADFHPPLYYLVIHYWTVLFGTSEVVLRLPSVIFGILSIYTIYTIAKELKFKWPIIPALFLATSGLHIYYSQEARMYMMVSWLVSYLVLTYIRKQWKLFSVLLALIFLTDYLSILILPALFVHTVLYSKSDIKKFIYSIVPFGLTFVLWLPTFFKQLMNGMSVKSSMSGWWDILGAVSFKNIALIPTKFILGRVSLDNKVLYGFLITVLILIFGYAISKAKNKLVWSWFGLSLVLGILISFLIPTLTYFRYLFILPAFYLLVAENTNRYIIAIVLAVNIVSSSFYLLNAKFHRENWRELKNVVGSNVIVLSTTSQKEALIYYGLDNQIVSLQELKSNFPQQVWLSRYVWNVFDPSDSTRKNIEELGYNWSEEVNLNGVVVWKYIK